MTNQNDGYSKELLDELISGCLDDMKQIVAEKKFFEDLYSRDLYQKDRNAHITLDILENLKKRHQNAEADYYRFKKLQVSS